MKLHGAAKTVISLVLVVSLAGCATMFNGSSQVISIRSSMDDAKLYVNESYIGKGNGTETFQKKKNYTITARKEGCRDTSVVAAKSFDPTTLLGILLDWGIISILIVDGAATGAVQKFDKTSYLIDPDCSGKAVESVNPVQGSVQKEDKKESETVKTEPAHSSMNFSGKK